MDTEKERDKMKLIYFT